MCLKNGLATVDIMYILIYKHKFKKKVNKNVLLSKDHQPFIVYTHIYVCMQFFRIRLY